MKRSLVLALCGLLLSAVTWAASGINYNGTNYLFIGAFGDNDLAFNDEYYIYYLPEPAITPDGHWMAIKSKKYVLLWERQGSESLSVTVTRQPVQIAAYEEEEQGESLAWYDASLFYTTSDSKKNTPIYQYQRPIDTSDIDQITNDQSPITNKIIKDNRLLILRGDKTYTITGQQIR